MGIATFTYTLALIMGFTGSLHCAGMCGPIMLVMPFRVFSGIKKWVSIFLYHFGRISVYALFGVLLHSFRSLFHPQYQQFVSIALGISLLVIGVLSFSPGKSLKFQLPWASAIKDNLSKVLCSPNLAKISIAGIMNGLLPCGLVYMALSSSMAASSGLQAAMLMYCFGIGTLPMLLGITVLKSKLAAFHIFNFRKLVPVMMFALGSLFILRGMNLGIPYLSPKAVITPNGIKSSCCHK